LQMRFAVCNRLAARVRVLALTQRITLGIVTLPGENSIDLAFPVAQVPLFSLGEVASLALVSVAVATSLVGVEVLERLRLAAHLASLHRPTLRRGCDIYAAYT